MEVADGLKAARSIDPALLIVDRMLSNRDSLSMIETLSGEGNRTPVLFVSGLAAVDERVRGLKAGGDDYLTKPLAMGELAARVEALLRRSNDAPTVMRRAHADSQRAPVWVQARCGRKFTPAGGSVKIIAKMTSAGPVVRVSDTVAISDRSRIFKRFCRSEENRHIPGTGLGLSMAATIARLHGFDLRVADNHPGAAFEMAARTFDETTSSPSPDHIRPAHIPTTPSKAAAQSIK